MVLSWSGVLTILNFFVGQKKQDLRGFRPNGDFIFPYAYPLLPPVGARAKKVGILGRSTFGKSRSAINW